MNNFLLIIAMIVSCFIAMQAGRASAEALADGWILWSFITFLVFIGGFILYGMLYLSLIGGF